MEDYGWRERRENNRYHYDTGWDNGTVRNDNNCSYYIHNIINKYSDSMISMMIIVDTIMEIVIIIMLEIIGTREREERVL